MSGATPSFLTPVSLEDFYATYWEKQPLHIARSDSMALINNDCLIDNNAIENLLATQSVYFPGVQVTRSDQAIDVRSYTDEQSRILPLRLFEHYSNGATIVLSQAQKLFTSLSSLCREVIRTMNMRCQTNIYLSPPGNQGFRAHYDTHDVFILQVSGKKTFNFYPSSVELPLPEESFDANRLEKSPIDESISLSAGDTLYIPRGVVHDAIADDKAPSIHVTLGVYPLLMRDVLQGSIQWLAEHDKRFRQSTNSVVSSTEDQCHGNLQQTLNTLVQQVQASLQNSDTLQRVLTRHYDELALNAAQDCTGRLLGKRIQQSTDNALDGFDSIILRKHMIISHETHGATLKIRTFGQTVEFSLPVSTLVKRLLEQGQIGNDELCGLQIDQRDAMINCLLKENLVELV